MWLKVLHRQWFHQIVDAAFQVLSPELDQSCYFKLAGTCFYDLLLELTRFLKHVQDIFRTVQHDDEITACSCNFLASRNDWMAYLHVCGTCSQMNTSQVCSCVWDSVDRHTAGYMAQHVPRTRGDGCLCHKNIFCFTSLFKAEEWRMIWRASCFNVHVHVDGEDSQHESSWPQATVRLISPSSSIIVGWTGALRGSRPSRTDPSSCWGFLLGEASHLMDELCLRLGWTLYS